MCKSSKVRNLLVIDIHQRMSQKDLKSDHMVLGRKLAYRMREGNHLARTKIKDREENTGVDIAETIGNASFQGIQEHSASVREKKKQSEVHRKGGYVLSILDKLSHLIFIKITLGIVNSIYEENMHTQLNIFGKIT